MSAMKKTRREAVLQHIAKAIESFTFSIQLRRGRQGKRVMSTVIAKVSGLPGVGFEELLKI